MAADDAANSPPTYFPEAVTQRASRSKDLSISSNPDVLHAHHAHFTLDVNFETKKISGSVIYSFTAQDVENVFVVDSSPQLILDVSADLSVESVFVADGGDIVGGVEAFAAEKALGNSTPYKILPAAQKAFGCALHVMLPADLRQDPKQGAARTLKSDTLFVKVSYSTAPTASSCQWLDPANTAGGKYP